VNAGVPLSVWLAKYWARYWPFGHISCTGGLPVGVVFAEIVIGTLVADWFCSSVTRSLAW
jgi:hypothetical protein